MTSLLDPSHLYPSLISHISYISSHKQFLVYLSNSILLIACNPFLINCFSCVYCHLYSFLLSLYLITSHVFRATAMYLSIFTLSHRPYLFCLFHVLIFLPTFSPFFFLTFYRLSSLPLNSDSFSEPFSLDNFF